MCTFKWLHSLTKKVEQRKVWHTLYISNCKYFTIFLGIFHTWVYVFVMWGIMHACIEVGVSWITHFKTWHMCILFKNEIKWGLLCKKVRKLAVFNVLSFFYKTKKSITSAPWITCKIPYFIFWHIPGIQCSFWFDSEKSI